MPKASICMYGRMLHVERYVLCRIVSYDSYRMVMAEKSLHTRVN
jgi:hypothetical protein